MFKRYFNLFIISIISLYFPCVSADTISTFGWVIEEKNVQWPAEVQEEHLLKLFEEKGILIATLPSDDWKEFSFLFPNIAFVEDASVLVAEEIWQNQIVRVVTTEEGYIRIFPIRKVRELSDLSREEKLEIEKTAVKLGNVFQQVLGSSDYVKWIPMGEKAGQKGDFFYVEILPAAEEQAETVDLLKKFQCTAYITMKGICSYPGLSKENRDKIKSCVQSVFEQDILSSEPSKQLAFFSNRHLKQIIPSLHFIANSILRRLHETGKAVHPIARMSMEVENPSLPHPDLKKGPCVFCSDSIIQQQLVYESLENWVTTNNRPYGRVHFMTITKEHIENGYPLKEEQILDKYRLWERLDRIVREHLHGEGTVIMTRCGLGAGQTIPHNHDHILGINSKEVPFWLFNAFYEIARDPKRIGILDSEGMKAVRREIEPLLQ